MFAVLLLHCPVIASGMTESQPQEPLMMYKNSDAHFSIKIPSVATEKSSGSNRIVWEYAPFESSDTADTSTEPPVTIRINYIFLGVAINPEEYINILQESKKNDGMEVSPASIKNGKGFSYKSSSKDSNDDIGSVYLVAVSGEGWVCTTTIMAKWTVLKKELGRAKEIFDSFEFQLPGKK